MSVIAIRAALEAALKAITPAIDTGWENAPFTPTTGTPYQLVYLMPASPENPTMGTGHYRFIGIFQINLFYPTQTGSGTAAARAELIKAAFARGNSFTKSGVTVKILYTPEIGQGRADDDRWMIPVKIRFSADIFS